MSFVKFWNDLSRPLLTMATRSSGLDRALDELTQDLAYDEGLARRDEQRVEHDEIGPAPRGRAYVGHDIGLHAKGGDQRRRRGGRQRKIDDGECGDVLNAAVFDDLEGVAREAADRLALRVNDAGVHRDVLDTASEHRAIGRLRVLQRDPARNDDDDRTGKCPPDHAGRSMRYSYAHG